MNSITKKLVVLVGLSGVFVGNSFALSFTVKACRDLYAQLRELQKTPPALHFDGQKDKFATIFSDAQKTGLKKQYQDMVTGRMPDVYGKFMLPPNLQWTAYFENQYGKGGPFTYTGPANGPAVLGYYIASDLKKLTMTSYGVLEGLFEEMRDDKFFVPTLYVSLKEAIRDAQGQIDATNKAKRGQPAQQGR